MDGVPWLSAEQDTSGTMHFVSLEWWCAGNFIYLFLRATGWQLAALFVSFLWHILTYNTSVCTGKIIVEQMCVKGITLSFSPRAFYPQWKGLLWLLRSVIWVSLFAPGLWSAIWVSFFHSRSVVRDTFQSLGMSVFWVKNGKCLVSDDNMQWYISGTPGFYAYLNCIFICKL